MDLRRFTGVRFISRAPTRGGGEVALPLLAAGWREFLRRLLAVHDRPAGGP